MAETDASSGRPAAAEPPWTGFATVLAASRSLARQPHLPLLLGARLRYGRWLAPRIAGCVGWGRHARNAPLVDLCRREGLPFVYLEDPVFRSWGLSAERHASPPVGVTLDRVGPYYDCTGSELERRILAAPSVSPGDEAGRLRRLIVAQRLSKYILPERRIRLGDGRPVIGVVDQVLQDRSIAFGGGDMAAMAALAAHVVARARAEEAAVALRTHPDVVSGKGSSALEQVLRAACDASGQTLIVTCEGGAADFLDAVDSVVTLTSGLGFEALLRAMPVTCFGAPFYAGFGLTTDLGPHPDARAAYARRALPPPDDPQRRLDAIVRALLVDLTLWWDPVRRERCDAETALRRLASWRGMDRIAGDVLSIHGVSRWKRKALAAMAASPGQTTRVSIFSRPRKLPDGATAIVWGADAAAGVEPPPVRAEDGFIRSVGLGAALVSPSSLVFDRTGLHYDATRPSDLERILQSGQGLDDRVLARAQALRRRIVEAGIDKYNLAAEAGQGAIASGYELVIGQVVDDASIRHGAASCLPGEALVRRVRAERGAARIVYRPHPDVTAGLRNGDAASAAADIVAAKAPIPALIAGAARVHTVTSLAGFEALLRAVPVSTYGMPFYAGWGLTDDAVRCPRRTRRATLDELVAAALILYPRYLGIRSGLRCEVEDVIDEILEIRAGRLRGPAGRRPWALPFVRIASEFSKRTGIRF